MLFNSYVFIFLFFPITLIGFSLLGRFKRHRTSIAWLVAASLLFYSWKRYENLALILSSIIFNYFLGTLLSKESDPKKKLFLTIGIAGNLCLLGYFKYANFLVDNINQIFGSTYHLATVYLPLAISFFTFQQIAYLVDAYYGKTKEYNFLDYCLFISFFPQLIAGPIVHHSEVMPQFRQRESLRFKIDNLSVGITIVCIGLFKKVVLADGFAIYGDPLFEAASAGTRLSFAESCLGTLSFGLEIYFDFSGYSDMAIGLARIFGIGIPVNFESPYKATNIIDFWRRWHITLSRFLRNYLYIPLGGNRKGRMRRYLNLVITMLLGGLWHGAGWNFVIWGGLHGIYLAINHGWRVVKEKFFAESGKRLVHPWLAARAGQLATFVLVSVAWVFFRAEDFDSSVLVIEGIFGRNDISWDRLKVFDETLSILNWMSASTNALILLAVVWFLPNSRELFDNSPDAGRIKWRPTMLWGLLVAAMTIFSLYFMMVQVNEEFIYFQF